MDLDMALGSKSIGLLRELQGHESDLFLSYFRPCILPLNGAKGVPDEEGSKGDPRLWQIKGERFVHVRQVCGAKTGRHIRQISDLLRAEDSRSCCKSSHAIVECVAHAGWSFVAQSLLCLGLLAGSVCKDQPGTLVCLHPERRQEDLPVQWRLVQQAGQEQWP